MGYKMRICQLDCRVLQSILSINSTGLPFPTCHSHLPKSRFVSAGSSEITSFLQFFLQVLSESPCIELPHHVNPAQNSSELSLHSALHLAFHFWLPRVVTALFLRPHRPGRYRFFPQCLSFPWLSWPQCCSQCSWGIVSDSYLSRNMVPLSSYKQIFLLNKILVNLFSIGSDFLLHFIPVIIVSSADTVIHSDNWHL